MKIFIILLSSILTKRNIMLWWCPVPSVGQSFCPGPYSPLVPWLSKDLQDLTTGYLSLSSFILFLMPPLWACFQTCQSPTPPQVDPLQLSFPLPGYPFHPQFHIKVPSFKELSEEKAVKEESRVRSVLWREESDVIQSSQSTKGERGRFPIRRKYSSMEKGKSF